MRWVGFILITLFLSLTFYSMPAGAIDAVEPADEHYAPLFITTFQTDNNGLNFIEIYNSLSTPVDLSGWNIVVTGDTVACSIPLGKWILAGQYTVLAQPEKVNDTTGNVELYSCGEDVLNVVSVALHNGTLDEDDVTMIDDTTLPVGTWMRKGITKTYRTDNFSKDFRSYVTGGTSPDRSLNAQQLYTPALNPGLQISEILPNARNCSPLEASLDCNDYVKLYNPNGQAIDLSDYRLRNGYQGQTSSSSNTTNLSGQILPGQYAVMPISLTNSASWLWFEDSYGVTRYDSSVQGYPNASSDSKKGQAWAYDEVDGVWKWTVQPTPYDGPSVFPVPVKEVIAETTTLVPCKENQYRSEETNRCRLVTTATNELVPCKEGQYRSEETNRCRSVVSAISSLVPCNAGQERNPTTHRCRNVASLTSSLKPCEENQERNPETNRCRNIVKSVPATAFAVEPIKETGKAFVGWWALGGVGVLAAGYGVWEWRSELMIGIRKVAIFFNSSK